MLALLAAMAACASAPARFPLREPIWRDTDLDPVSVACRPDPKKPGHRLCRPDAYESSFAWDGFDNLVTRPFVKLFAFEVSGEAVNVNSYDETPDSSWFVNRIGRMPMSPDEVRRGPCGDDTLPTDGPDGSWLIDMGKANGATPGFRIALPDGRRYMLKSDDAPGNERETGAGVVATRIYHAAGWWTTCDAVIYMRPAIFTLRPGLTVTDNTGTTRPFDRAALDRVLTRANHHGELVRMSASRWLSGRTLGPFRYEGTNDDDPNDVIPHEDRRDLRGARVFAAWLNHFDAREQNSMRVWLAADPSDADSSPGLVRHYYMDVGDSFGSEWAWDGISRRLGHAYYLDFKYLFADFLTFGLIVRPWDRAQRSDEGSIFGYFGARDFDPDSWHGGYPNPTFDRTTEHDAAWAARIIARFSDEHIAAAVSVSDYSDPRHAAYLAHTLSARRDIILRRYLSVLSPVTDLRVAGDEVCGVDLARKSGLFADASFRYGGAVRAGRDQKLLRTRPAVHAGADGTVCVALPRIAGDDGPPRDDAARYLVVYLINRQAPGRLLLHLYDLGPTRGYRLVGIQRQNP